jgi:PEP-CTERM motif
MLRFTYRIGVALVFFAAIAGASAQAALIVPGTTDLTGVAIQDLTLLPNTPFNPGPVPIFIPGVSGVATITINRDAQIGNSITIPNLAGGVFFGSNPALGSYIFGNIPPLTGADFSGIINNVVQNPADPGFATGQPSSFQSGDFSFGGASFGFEFLTGPAAGVKLFTDPAVPFSFSAHFDGLPPSQGTVLQNSGPDALNVLFNGAPVALTSNRRIVLESVPEPGSLALFGIGLLLVASCRRRVDPRWTRTKSI